MTFNVVTEEDGRCELVLDDEGIAYLLEGLEKLTRGAEEVSSPTLLEEAFGVQVIGHVAQDWTSVTSQPNPTGEVLMIPLENSPNLLTGGTSDLKPAIALNDAANKFFTDMIHASEFTSFPQRVMTGVELPRDPVTGEVLDETQIRAAVSRMWAFEDPDAKVFQLNAGDLGAYVEGIDLAVQHLAAQTRTPPHYLLAKLANLSGDALKAAETGLVARCKRKHTDFSDSWEEAMRLAFRWRAWARGNSKQDLERSKMTDAETIWNDPESRHPGQVGDSLVKKKAVNVPDEILWEEAGYTPQQIKRMKVLRAEEQRMEMLLEGRKGAGEHGDGNQEGRRPSAGGVIIPGSGGLAA